MLTQSLTSSKGAVWTFRQAGEEEWLPATVPGGVHTDLLALGRIPDPFVADNELKVQWVAESEWEYRGVFTVSPELAQAPHLFLVADGVDTLADMSLNGKVLGKTENAFRQYRWDVAGLVKAGENEIRVFFHSAVKFCRQRNQEKPLTPKVGMSLEGSVFVRKAPCQFGWDWGPKLPPIGVWRDLRLQGYTQARLDDVHFRQRVEGKKAYISADVRAEVWGKTPLTAHLRVTAPNGKKTFETSAPLVEGTAALQVAISNPQLWWPNGYGDQPLYRVEVWLESSEGVEDQKAVQMGLRTIELRREPDEWGESFTFIVNGVPVFMKGADWIPADSFPTRLTDAHYEHLIRSAAESHQNMLRVWGGGFYEDERFYDLCDRYGILLWHDFMFACYIYPHDEAEFIENLRYEVEDNVRRLRHRTCIALWCGNNEMEQGWADWGWTNPTDPLRVTEREAYERFFYHTLPAWVEKLDPDRPYWPSSASSNEPFVNPNSQDRGDMHYWDVWHGRKPFTAYRTVYPRFMSEFGFQSLPPLETIRTYAAPEDWNMTSYIMEHHQRNFSGNGLMIGQMTDTFRMPKDFPALVYLSMMLQAEGIRYGVEHWRRFPERVAGTLIWQLNDCWPVASWSSLDYFGRWKALHYAARKFYAPVLLSIADRGGVPAEGIREPWLLTPADWGATMGLHVTNDLTEAWQGTVRWSLETLNGELLEKGRYDVTVPARSARKVAELNFARKLAEPDINRREVVLWAELWQGDRLLARQCGTFTPNKHLALADPHLDVAVDVQDDALAIEVAAASTARFVELALDGAGALGDVVFSDNYFDVPAGKTVTVTCPLPAGWTLDDARAALRVQSLYDSYA